MPDNFVFADEAGFADIVNQPCSAAVFTSGLFFFSTVAFYFGIATCDDIVGTRILNESFR